MEHEPLCDMAGECEAPHDTRGLTNCIYCGKELVEKDGSWWTWDSDLHPTQNPQGYVQSLTK